MPFPLNSRGKIEAWVGDDSLDRSNYKSMFIGKFSDELRGMGRQDVFVLAGNGGLDKGSPQLFFPRGNLVSFGICTQGSFAFGKRKGLLGNYGLSGLISGEVEIELRDELLVVSYYLSYKLPLALFSTMLLGVLGLWIAVDDRPTFSWGVAGIILIMWLFLLGPSYISDLVAFPRLIKKVVKSVRDQIALNNSLSTSGS